MTKSKELLIIGAGETAQLAFEYFTFDSDFKVVAFCVEKKYLEQREIFGLPVIPIEEIEHEYNPKDYFAFIAISSTGINRVRTRLYQTIKRKNYQIASYISSKAFIWRNVEIGENCFIMENNVLQHLVKIGNNVILWSGNHIGHRSIVHDNCFISSHVVVSGSSEIKDNCFLGVNSTINDGVRIAEDCVIGSGAVIISDTEPGMVYVGCPGKPIKKAVTSPSRST